MLLIKKNERERERELETGKKKVLFIDLSFLVLFLKEDQ